MSRPLDQKPADYRFGGNCGVLSIAMCANVSFEKAWAACRMRKGSKGGTTHYQRVQALKALGVRFEEPALYARKAVTLRTFVRDWTVPGVTYSITLAGHVVTVQDGIVMDQQSVKPAADHWCRNKRVKRAIKILEA